MTEEQYSSIIEAQDLGQEFFVWRMNPDNEYGDQEERLDAFQEEQGFTEDDEKVIALMQLTSENWGEAEFQIDSRYLVLTDDEADAKLDETLENYLEDCILCNIDQNYHQYFDRDAWKFDNDSNRAGWLDRDSGTEEEETVNGTTYFIYKQ